MSDARSAAYLKPSEMTASAALVAGDTFYKVDATSGNVETATGTQIMALDSSTAKTMSATLTVGEDDTGYDVTFYGATSGQKVFWDESADTLNLDCTNQVDGTLTVGVDDTGYDVTFFGATAGKKVLWDESADSLLVRGETFGTQGAPTAETGAATIAAADLISGIITISHTTGSTVALTLDTGTAMDTALPQCDAVGDCFDWHIINISAALADTATVTNASGHTIVGEAVVESAHADSEFQSSAHFRSRRTAANTWVTYRLA